ncbi:hypothetical protein FRUB_07091 [Fimbriiglobus ruber]|uniref:ASPIC/UnbV domain-containing protein n=1 Tax=Fimbriiglobus ruber TaxID=1908690 RepID=A0A225D8U0_9BACT|nr:hypothetical protein FRUB_07091 [Fimbriiglobus ruber]
MGVSAVLLAALLYWRSLTPPDSSEAIATFPPVTFTDVTERAGIHFRHVNGATGLKLLPETMGAGVAVIDFDRDGWPDLFFVNSRPWPGHPEAASGRATQALYRNKGDGTFEDVSAAAGLDIELYGMGCAVADFDNDGWPDLFVTAVGGNRLYHNEPGPNGRRFVDVTDRAGVGGGGTWPVVSASDFVKWDKPIPFPSSATWLDYDGDGRLDLFVCDYVTWAPALDLGIRAVLPGGKRAYVPPTYFSGTHCALYRNVDGVRFEDVSARAGVRVSEPVAPGGPPQPGGKSLGVVVCDPDGDGWPDLIVANDTVRNFFFHNVPGPGGSRVFEEIGLTANVAYADGRARGGMGVDAAEVRPGQLAAVVANFTNEPDTLLTLRERSPLMFRETATADGLAGASREPMKFGALFFDYDLDGRPDLFTCNGHLEPDISRVQPHHTFAQSAQLFRNTGRPSGGLFEPVPPDRAGPDLFRPIVGRGCAYLDFDGDGAWDLVVIENNGPARLLRADNRTGNNWLRFTLEGDPAVSNRDALGAEVTIESGGQTRRQYVTASRGYLSGSELTVAFGLGRENGAERVRVRWPGRKGVVQEWTGLEAGHLYRLTQGRAEATMVTCGGR